MWGGQPYSRFSCDMHLYITICVYSCVLFLNFVMEVMNDASYFIADGEDYIGGFLMLPLLRGESQSCLSISIVDDSILEDQIETFQVFLSSVDPGVDNSASMATVQIFDDDGELHVDSVLNVYRGCP